MLQSIMNGSALPLLEKVAAFAERRHEVLAGNIANINTPDYKRLDLPVADFQQALRQAVERRHSGGSFGMAEAGEGLTSPGEIEQIFSKELFEAATAVPQNVTFQDGNNRSIELEITELTKNSMLHTYAVEMITAQTNLLESIIAERP